MNLSFLRRHCVRYVFIAVIFLTLFGVGYYYYFYRSVLTFHSDWTEADKQQMKEVMAGMKKMREFMVWMAKYNFDEQTKSLSMGNLGDWSRLSRSSYGYYKDKSDVDDMISCWENAVVQTARTGNAAHIGKYNFTLLQAACGLGKRELVCHLIDKGADVNIRNMVKRDGVVSPGSAPIHSLGWIWPSDGPETFNVETRIYLMEQLAAHGTDLNMRESDALCPFESFCILGLRYGKGSCEKLLLKLIDLGADVSSPFEDSSSGGRKLSSSFRYPMVQGLDKVVERLCKEGVDPNEGYDELPPLFYINLKKGPEYQVNIARALLDHGAKINAAVPSRLGRELDTVGQTPLIYLCKMVSEIPEIDEKQKQCLFDLLSLYCERMADVNQACEKGETPLMYLFDRCASVGNQEVKIEVARMLLKNGADPSLKNKEGETVLSMIKKYSGNEKKIFDELPELQRGAGKSDGNRIKR